MSRTATGRGGRARAAATPVVPAVAVAFALAVAAPAWTGPVSAQTPAGMRSAPAEARGAAGVTAQTSGGALVLSFAAGANEARQDAARREVYLRFDRALDPAAVEAVLAGASDWVESWSLGYDSLLLRAGRPVDFRMREGDGRFDLRLAPPTPAEAPDATPGAAAVAAVDARIAAQRARALAATGRTDEARAIARDLQAQRPEDPEVLAALAEVEGGLGAWRRAARLYDKALARRPGNQSLARSRADLLRRFGPRLRTGVDYQSVEGGDDQIATTASGTWYPGERWSVSAAYEGRHLKDDAIRAADGSLRAVDATFHQGEIVAGYDLGGSTLRAGATLSGDDIGAVVAWLRRTPVSETEVTATWNRPYWELEEGIFSGGTRDSLEVGYEHRFGPEWSAGARVFAARYGVGGAADAGYGFGFSATGRYSRALFGLSASAGLSVEAEYVSDVLEATDAGGTVYRPLPLVDREIYAADLSLTEEFSRGVSATVFGGWAYDRFADDGPFGGASLNARLGDRLDADIFASYSDVTGRGEEGAVTRFGASATYYFPFGAPETPAPRAGPAEAGGDVNGG